jgi:hypothetical protein
MKLTVRTNNSETGTACSVRWNHFKDSMEYAGKRLQGVTETVLIHSLKEIKLSPIFPEPRKKTGILERVGLWLCLELYATLFLGLGIFGTFSRKIYEDQNILERAEKILSDFVPPLLMTPQQKIAVDTFNRLLNGSLLLGAMVLPTIYLSLIAAKKIKDEIKEHIN